jgi:molecular chaperone DnaK
MTKIIGIDLGTSNSAASVMMGGRPTLIPSAEGTTVAGKAFPSVVAFTSDGQMLVGEPARRQAVKNPDGTIFTAKRKMGTDHKFNVFDKQYSPQQISSFILQKIKKDAESFLNDKVDKAVITVPAYFDDNQRQATKDAGEIAGLEVVRIINEPTAASLSYGLDKSDQEMKIMVFDFGGGTLDVTILEFGNGLFEVKSTSGDTQLGGTDMDNILADYVVKEFESETGLNLHQDNMAMTRIREAVEKAKIELSTTLSTEINLPFISADSSGPKHLVKSFTRSKLEELVRPLLERCKNPITQSIQDAKLTSNDIEKIILVGGPTRMPIVSKVIQEILNKEPERGVDPMECVSLGASIQAGVIAGDVTDVLLLDVTPLSLGIETLGSVFTKILEKNTTIPTKRSQIFSTAADSQTTVTVHVLQGERQMVSDNISLGQFNLTDIPPAPRGLPQIEVTFDIDANGILNVSAKDKATNKEQSITISASNKLSDEEKERLTKEAEKFHEEDKKKLEEAELRNLSDSAIYTAEKTTSELADKLKPEDKEKIDNAVAELKGSLSGQDISLIKSKNEELQKIIQDIGASIHQQSQDANTASDSQTTSDSQPDESSDGSQKADPVDADYKVDNEEDK